MVGKSDEGEGEGRRGGGGGRRYGERSIERGRVAAVERGGVRPGQSVTMSLV